MAYPNTYPTPAEIATVKARLLTTYKAGIWGGYAFLKAIDSARIGPWIYYPLYELGADAVESLARKFTASGLMSADDVCEFLRAEHVA